ncbi:hypothetical protein NL676_001089 [Syzygium grande]|nr:hypothetical protein NL676_001089 [Syzygium grande]
MLFSCRQNRPLDASDLSSPTIDISYAQNGIASLVGVKDIMQTEDGIKEWWKGDLPRKETLISQVSFGRKSMLKAYVEIPWNIRLHRNEVYVTLWVPRIVQSFDCLKSLHFRRMIVEDSDLACLGDHRDAFCKCSNSTSSLVSRRMGSYTRGICAGYCFTFLWVLD